MHLVSLLQHQQGMPAVQPKEKPTQNSEADPSPAVQPKEKPRQKCEADPSPDAALACHSVNTVVQ